MNETLTVVQAYKAMYAYLVHLYEMTNSDDLGGFLGSMSFLASGGTADPAIWSDWLEAVRKANADEVDADLHIDNQQD